jgi:hypothetical protein
LKACTEKILDSLRKASEKPETVRAAIRVYAALPGRDPDTNPLEESKVEDAFFQALLDDLASMRKKAKAAKLCRKDEEG